MSSTATANTNAASLRNHHHHPSLVHIPLGKQGPRWTTTLTASKTTTSDPDNNNNNDTSNSSTETTNNQINEIGKLEALKQLETELALQLAAVRQEKLKTIQSRPLTMGIIGFGRFGQFIARTFQKYGRVIVTSRTDYTALASSMGITYLSDPADFVAQKLDVIVVAVSIVSFDATIQMLAPYLKRDIQQQREQQQQLPLGMTATTMTTNTTLSSSSLSSSVSLPPVRGPLIVDVLSVKEHARNIMLQHLPPECDILCTHPMFGPDSGKDSWRNLNFVYERTRINQVVLDDNDTLVDDRGLVHSIHEDCEAHVEGMDRMERFLSIWEEEGCHMVPLSCRDHDAYAANSQFLTHLIGRVLGSQGLSPTPIDTAGFQSVLKLVDTTTADSFDLFYGLYKYNQNSFETIKKLQTAMEDVVQNLQIMEQQEGEK